MWRKTECAIWGMECDGWDDPAKRIYWFDSPRAGGKYAIFEEAMFYLAQCDDHTKARLTSWLVERRNGGEKCPKISRNVLDRAKQRSNTSVQQKIDKLLQIMWNKSPTMGSSIRIMNRKSAEFLHFDGPLYEDEFVAWTECINNSELDYLLKTMMQQNILENLAGAYVITFYGHDRLHKLAKIQVDSSQAFVAMWFDESINEAYENGIALGVEGAGYNPVRIDRKDFNGKIDDEIIAEIRRSRFVVADFTQGESGARGGVYYEAGFAHGLGIPVIFTCREDAIDEVHFDTIHYNHIVWSDSEDLRARLSKRISAVIGDGPNKSPP